MHPSEINNEVKCQGAINGKIRTDVCFGKDSCSVENIKKLKNLKMKNVLIITFSWQVQHR